MTKNTRVSRTAPCVMELGTVWMVKMKLTAVSYNYYDTRHTPYQVPNTSNVTVRRTPRTMPNAPRAIWTP
jgi:hypothetical protein